MVPVARWVFGVLSVTKYKLSLAAIVGGLLLAGAANAAIITATATVGGAPTGVIRDNLDIIPLGSGGGVSATGIVVSFAPDGGAVQGAVVNMYAAPYLSGSNGLGFGNPGDQPLGADTTTYLTAGGHRGSSATLLLPLDVTYFGLLWGSVDDYNTLELYHDDTLIGTVTGTQVTNPKYPNGDQSANGTYYVNITSDTFFNKVVALSSQHAFEFDNVAYNRTVPSPEPVTLSLVGAGLAGLGLSRRRRKA